MYILVFLHSIIPTLYLLYIKENMFSYPFDKKRVLKFGGINNLYYLCRK